jgi:hypothetical protein
MEKSTHFSPETVHRTQAAFLWTHILRAPFWAIYNLLLFILYKDLHASAFQIALFIALKPVVSLFSIYWSSAIYQRPDRLLSNVVWAGALGYLPFLFFPFFYNAWFVIFASALFMTMHRGVVPAWMEIFKRNLPGASKQKIFSYGSMLSYVIGSLLPIVMGPMLDHFALCWRWIFVVTALVGLGAIIFQRRIPALLNTTQRIEPQRSIRPLNHIFAPWKHAIHLLRSHADFRAYQIGFMVCGGCGLMILQPALPSFFMDALGLSYTELAIALNLCKGIGFVLTSQIWANGMQKIDIFRFSTVVIFLGALFPCILLCAQMHLFWIYAAYLVYGVMQAGSELSWHLSGPIFAKEKESSQFSGVNILTVGLRGSTIPQLGAFLSLLTPSSFILVIGTLLCLTGAFWMILYHKKRASVNSPS